MSTRLKATDKPEPWQSSRKGASGTPVQKTTSKKVAAVEDSVMVNVQGEPGRRGRPPSKSAPKVVPSPKGMKRTKALPASTLNIFLGASRTSVADVEELRQKRERDAKACGRTVRTISPHLNRTSRPTTLPKVSSEGDRTNDEAGDSASQAHASPTKYSRTMPLAEDNNGQDEMALALVDEVGGGDKRTASRRAGKDPVTEDVLEPIPLPQVKRNGDDLLQQSVQMESDRDSQGRERGLGGRRGKHNRSPTTNYSAESNEVIEIEQKKSTDARLQSHRQRMEESVSMKPRRNMNRGSVLPESRSDHRSQSQSLIRRRGGHLQSNVKDFDECYRYPSSRRFREEYQNSRDFYSRGRRRSRQDKSSSLESSRRHKKRRSTKSGRTSRRQSTTSQSSMSPPRRSITSRDDMTTQWTNIVAVKAGDIAETSTASDRRRRRHQQALLDADKTRRQENGNKPFYLMLDREGRPYSTGKPSWIAEINKLAIGLDPSCMDIRKQTFQDVQTFKNRLDDKFEYSGTLNEDYLRALMGKAVTKRRSELISLIKRNGSQPEYIDEQVWRRLEKLSTSKQREERSQQGRYANACRKTLGRTGCRGVDGVREKLHSLLGRSPDPSEVEEEMHRDKGYGGQRRKKLICPIKVEKNYREMRMVDEDRPSHRSSRNADEVNSDSDYVELQERQVKVVAEKIRRGRRNALQEEDDLAGTTDTGQRSFHVTQANNTSKEEYIRELEAEIHLLRQGNENASSSDADMSS